jgi:glycosyltransferase involved in cell wall biosynthesis
MKILHLLCFPLWGSGSGTYARKLCEKTALLNNKVAIVTPDNRPIKKVKIFEVKLPFFAAFTGHSEHPKCKKYSELDNSEITKILKAFYKKTIDAIEKFKPEIIVVHHASFFTWIANYIKAIYGIPFIVIEHGTGILNSTLDKRYFPLTKDALNRASNIVCVSGDTKKWFFKVYGRKNANRMKVIPGGVDLETYNHKSSIKIINKKYGLKDKKVVIFVGKLTKPKGTIYLIKAAPKIKGEIFILGSGDEKDNLKKYISENKIRNVHLMGYFGKEYIKELREFYRRADVFVMPSIWDEPLGLVVLEAMACGTPVVASKKGGIPLAVKNKVNGILIRSRSPKSIVEAVNKILDNPKMAKRMGGEARKRLEEKFNWIFIAKRYEEVTKHIADKYRLKNKKIDKKLTNIDIKRESRELKKKKIDYR